MPIRDDLEEAHARAWRAIASPGTWLTGARRLQVAAEVRRSEGCAVCDAGGLHETAELELVHCLAREPGRTSEAWARSLLGTAEAKGLSEGEYVETVGLVAMVKMMDAFHLGLGRELSPLPEPIEGEPTRYRPPGAKVGAAWLPIVEPPDVTPDDGPMYPSPKAGYIYRALSSVPQSMRDYWALANPHYLPGEYVYAFDRSLRAITRPQMELLASRVSAMHQCAY